MSNPFTKLRQQPPSLVGLGFTIVAILAAGLVLSLAIAAVTIYKQQLYRGGFCLTADCVAFLAHAVSPALEVAKATLDVGVAIATIGGIFVALLSYISSASTAALTNHLEHLKVFTEYIEAELTKRDRLSRSNFDILLLYSKIFSQSRIGKTTVSEDYKEFILGLNRIIEESNERCSSGTPGGFSYNGHQRLVRDHLKPLGITVVNAPRNDYFEMESQLFSLLHRVSQSFCPAGLLPAICERKYH